MRVIAVHLLAPGDRVDLLPWALLHPDEDTRHFLDEDGWVNRFEQEFCVVSAIEFCNGVRVRFRSHPTQRFDHDELVPVKVEVARCPECGDMHNLARCESEHGGGVACDCCRAIRRGNWP